MMNAATENTPCIYGCHEFADHESKCHVCAAPSDALDREIGRFPAVFKMYSAPNRLFRIEKSGSAMHGRYPRFALQVKTERGWVSLPKLMTVDELHAACNGASYCTLDVSTIPSFDKVVVDCSTKAVYGIFMKTKQAPRRVLYVVSVYCPVNCENTEMAFVNREDAFVRGALLAMRDGSVQIFKRWPSDFDNDRPKRPKCGLDRLICEMSRDGRANIKTRFIGGKLRVR